jgi:hypothetical protein
MGALRRCAASVSSSNRTCRTAFSSALKRGDFIRSMVRGRGRSTSTTPATRPGLADRICTRSAMKTASEIVCVTRIAVVPLSLPDAQKLHVHALARDLVERAEGFVHQKDLGFQHQRAGDGDALLHAARKLRGLGILEALQADQPDQRLGAAFGGDARDLDGQRHVFTHRAPRQQRRGLENETDLVVQARLLRRAAAHGDGALRTGRRHRR